jgi:hypothetical protein
MCDYQAVNQGKSAALYSIPIIINGQVIPADKPRTEQNTKRLVMNFSVTNDQCKDHKVLLLSDNQGRECAEKIKNQLPPNFEVWGMVKPGASSNSLYKSPLTGTNKLTCEDFVVLWQGSMDVSNNRATSGVKNILLFVMKNLHTNIIVISMPQRRDLPTLSHMNKEISLFNKKLEKCLKSCNGVSLIKTNCSRDNFSRLSKNFNSLDKVNVARQIMECIYTIINRKAKAPITLNRRMNMVESKMTEDSPASTTLTLEANSMQKTADGDMTRLGFNVSLASQVMPKTRANTLDKRIRRKPVTRSTDFLWEN